MQSESPSQTTPATPAAAQAASPSPSGNDPAPSFPIVGIGASAGGLEALDLFFRNLPPKNGMAFVVIQHMDPTKRGMLVELIQRVTGMPVKQVEDGEAVQAEHVYVIAPNKDLSLLGGKLHLLVPDSPRGLRLPIDYFFRSLADDQGERAVGVILSGMGSDGMLGMRAIKEAAGGCFVQDPASAKFDGMPTSSINAGLADVVAPPEELPAKIMEYQRLVIYQKSNDESQGKDLNSLEKIMILLRARTGNDFSLYKKHTVYRRIERRMGLQHIEKISTYVQFLQQNPLELDLLLKELLIGVTSFFRDKDVWEHLASEIVPSLASSRIEGGALRIWSLGCSTGEEAYSLAIVFAEALERLSPPGRLPVQIFATDLDKEAIDKARVGIYPPNIASDVSPARLSRFFVREEQGYRVCKQIRESVVFAPHNIIKDPPFTKLDLLVCRNLLIYFDQKLQRRLLPLFHYSLNALGVLFLGNAETVGTFSDLFEKIEGPGRFYSRRDAKLPSRIEFPSAIALPDAPEPSPAESELAVPNLQALADQLILQRFAPAAVLTTAGGDILYISGRTGKFLEPVAGKANWNIFAMARDGLRYELSNAYQKAIKEKDVVTSKGIRINVDKTEMRVDILVHPLTTPHALDGMVIAVFTESAELTKERKSKKALSNSARIDAVAELQQALKIARDELQGTREQMQASQEEIRSSNEELQSTNEELQSTNEELTTSKEEMQSINEELQTVNNELQAKIEELSRANNDMKNLLNSTDIATLFLDNALNVRRFTKQVTAIINLIPSDVGRPVTNITSSLQYDGMVDDALNVLRTLVFCEKPVSTQDGRWYLVRIMPYRTLDNRIDGLVITFTDISVAKKLEAALRESDRETQALFAKMPAPFALFATEQDSHGRFVGARFVFANKAFALATGRDEQNLKGMSMAEGWPGFSPDWLVVCAHTAMTGELGSFVVNGQIDGRKYTCKAYRPDESADRFCVLLEPIM